MQFLYPIGLLALAGLIFPVIIHLWSVKKGKTLKIGSINLLGESANATSKSLRITDWLLFVIRCLLLIFIGLMLAQPLLQKKLITNSKMGWILINQNQFAEVYPSHQKTIDSLLNLGFELHDFNFGFNKYELKDSLKKVENIILSYPSLLKKLNKKLPNGYTAYLFAPKRIADFESDLPKVDFKLNWFETQTTDSLKIWTSSFLGKDYEAKSTPTLTSYTSKAMQDLPTLTAMIYDPKGSDSKYIKAALRTITDFTKRKIEIKDYNSDLPADIMFWFSEQAIPSSYLAKLKPNSKVFSYVNGKVNAINSTLQLANSAYSNINLYQKIEGEKEQGEMIWKDGFGDPILIKQQNNQISHFYFYSKFNPKWSDLVWDENFVNALIPIVLGNQDTIEFGFENNKNDLRIIGSNQNLFLNSKENNAIITTLENFATAKYLWILALVVLIIERILSFRKTKISDVKN